MPALHLLHRRPRTSLARARVVCISRVVLEGKIPSSLAAIPARTAVVESSRLEGRLSHSKLFAREPNPKMSSLLRAKTEDVPENGRILDYSPSPLGTACTAYLETQAYFHKPQAHPPQFWYCETCKMGMVHSCPPGSTAPHPSGSCYDQGSLGLRSSALAPKGFKPAPKSFEKEPCTLSKLSSSPLLSWMAACCLIGASALAL